MKLEDALSGKAGLSGVRWVTSGSSSRRVVRSELAALLSDDIVLGRCRLRRVELRLGRRMRAYLDAAVGPTPGTWRPVAVTWKPQRKFKAIAGIEELEAEAVRAGWAAPFSGLHAARPDWGMNLLVAPLDPDLPELGRLADPRWATEMLGASRGREVTVTPLRYMPGRRHVLRYDPAPAGSSARPGRSSDARSIFLKLSADGTPGEVIRVAEQVAEWIGSSHIPHVLVTPAPVPEHHRALMYPRAEGVALSRLMLEPGPKGARALREAGGLLHRLQQTPLESERGLKAHEFLHELKVIARTGEHVGLLCPPAGRSFGSILERAEEIHARLPQEPATLVHGDFKAEHIYVAGAKLSLFDFDTCRLADPAFDAGKMLADLHWWFVTTGRPGLQDAERAFLEGYLAGAGGERLGRCRLWGALFLAKITARRAQMFTRRWTSVTRDLMGRAETGLRRVGHEIS